jgi:glycosyltransferase A (GT-A) superfamily protein (DUF2064 family)
MLLGLKDLREVLLDIPWSTETIHRATLDKARALGLSMYEGEPRYDVDTPEYLVRLKEELEADPWAAHHTRRGF